jgi:F-type H+-transporting ATPase subunit epsilon
MAETFKFELVSPEKLVLSADVASVVLPSKEGDMTVMARHAPLMTTLRAGLVTAGDTAIYVRGGFAEVGANGLTVLAEQAMPVSDMTGAAYDAELAAAEAEMAGAADDEARLAAETKKNQILALRAAAGR